MKNICVYIGSRANYSSCRSIMKALCSHKSLELTIMVGGSALLDRYGRMDDILRADGFTPSATFYMVVEGETPTTMAKSAGLGIIESSTILSNIAPDFLLVIGDRFDVIAPVLAAAFMNIPVIHTMGGEVTGTIDESIRHAITKLAHIHFPANQEALNRIVRLGENPEFVFNVGCPRIDSVKELIDNSRRYDLLNLFEEGVGPNLDLDTEPFLLVSQHPVTTEFGTNRAQIEATLDALQQLQMPTIMLWPNVDAGSDEISKGIRTFRERIQPNWLHLFKNLEIDKYFRLMDRCACMVGNSSSAIREGSFLGTPAVNIGTRQMGRSRGSNIIDVSPNSLEIKMAICQQLEQGRYEPNYLYGNGFASDKIVDIISRLPSISAQKKIFY